MKTLCQIAQEIQADFLLQYETNLDTTKPKVTSILRKTIGAFDCWTRTKLTVGSSPLEAQNFYKPGGTMVLALDNIVSTITAAGNDKLDRWSYQTVRGKNEKTITIISVYQVGKNSHRKLGTSTAGAQQFTLLRQEDATNIDPRHHFQKYLTNMIK